MKHLQKLATLLLAVLMVFALTTTAMAAMEGELTDGSITIDNAVVGQTYEVYQILYLESYNAGSNAYAYKANSEWASWLEAQTAYVTIDGQGYVTWVDGADVSAFVALAQAYADNNGIAPSVAAITATGTTVEFTGLKLGYYLVDTTLGTLCSIDTTNPTVTIKEKNVAPTVTKEVQEDSDDSWGETNDADIGQTVTFRATVTVQTGAENYILHDTMSAGLTFVGVTSVKIGDAEVAAENYTVTTGCDDDCTFELAFNNEYIATVAASTQIVVTYTATVNKSAVVGLDGNENSVKLQYGEKHSSASSPTFTTEDTTVTYTWDLDVLKYANGNESDVLANAKFVLLNSDKTSVASIVEGKVTGWVTITDDVDLDDYALTTDANGKIEIDGLDAGTYYLRETAAPAGYNKLAEDVAVVITGATSGEDDTLSYTTVLTKVENNSGTELPSTGGIGTTIFYIVGGLLVAGAVVLLVTKRRLGKMEE